jgi:hypothetical protein
VKSDGLIYPCCFSDEVMGDLRKQSFEEIWNGEKYQDLRKTLSNGQYWESCRKASCNWVDGQHSQQYNSKIDVLNPPAQIDGRTGGTLQVRITNAGGFVWQTPKNEPRFHVTLSYRLFNEALELIDEGLHVPLSKPVLPAEQHFMDLPIKPVPYSGKLLLKIDMVHEGTTWFGERGNNATEVPIEIINVPFAPYLSSHRAAVLRQQLEDTVLSPGQRFTLPIRVRNVGTEPLGGGPNADLLSYHWRAEDSSGDFIEWEGLRTTLPTIQPGESADLDAEVLVPKELATGRYRLEFDVLREDVEWVSLLWRRSMLTYPVKVARAPEETLLIPRTRTNGKPYTWEPKGQCVANTGNKGVW